MFMASAHFGLKQAGVVPNSYSDTFNRADSTTSLGTASGGGGAWVTRNSTMGINTNGAYTATTGGLGFATLTNTMAGDDQEASITIGTNSGTAQSLQCFVGANTAGERVQFSILGALTTISISTVATWAGTATAQASSTPAAAAVGDVFKLKRVGNVYTVYKNNVSTGLTWTDSTIIVPRDSSHRLVGIGVFNSGGSYRRIDAFAAVG